MRSFNLEYSVTRPFQPTLSKLLILTWIVVFLALSLFNFFTQSRFQQCLNVLQTEYQADSCRPATISFYDTYRTRPRLNTGTTTNTSLTKRDVFDPISAVAGRRRLIRRDDANQARTTANTIDQTGYGVGAFNWNMDALGNGTDIDIDLNVINIDYHAEILTCEVYQIILTLYLPISSFTYSMCAYCGTSTRLLCTLVDSVRTDIPYGIFNPELINIPHAFGTLAYLAQTAAAQEASAIAANITQGLPASPSIFTPNGGNLTDLWVVQNISLSGNKSTYTQVTENNTVLLLGNSYGFQFTSVNTTNATASGTDALSTIMKQVNSTCEFRATSVRCLFLVSLIQSVGEADLQGNPLLVTFQCTSCTWEYKTALTIFAIVVSSK